MVRHIAIVAILLAVASAWLSNPGAAQSRAQRSTTSNVPNAVQGFSKNRNQPIQIEASSLEVNDKTKVATFRGKVYVKQGDTELRCNTLVVHYEEDGVGVTNGSRPGTSAAEPQRIRRLGAKGGVLVRQKVQTATGD